MIIPPGFASISIPFKHTDLARSAFVTFGVESTNWPGDYVDMCNRIAADFETQWKSSIDTSVTVGPVEASVGQDGSENLSVVGTYSFVGTSSGERASANTALLLRKLTTRGGRRGRGRMFLPWVLADTSVSEIGRIDTPTVTAYQTKATAWLTAMALDPGSTPMVVLHSPSADDVSNPTPTGAPNEVTSLSVDATIGVQRRRLGR